MWTCRYRDTGTKNRCWAWPPNKMICQVIYYQGDTMTVTLKKH